MKKKNSIILGIIILILGFSIILVGIKLLLKEEKKEKTTYFFEGTKKIDVCISKENCSIVEVEYPFLTYETKSQKLKKIIKQINKETENYYEQTQQSSITASSCSHLKDMYKHSMIVHTDFTIYNGENLAGITVNRIKVDLCNNQYDYIKPKSYLLDKASDEFLSQNQIKEKFEVTDDILKKKVEENIIQINSSDNTAYDIENTSDYLLYLNFDGSVMLYYLQEENKQYYNVEIKK